MFLISFSRLGFALSLSFTKSIRKKKPLDLLSPAHADLEAQRLAQETFAGLERCLVGFEFVAAEDGRDDEGELHLFETRSAYGSLWLV
jgi:hypothetical protein